MFAFRSLSISITVVRDAADFFYMFLMDSCLTFKKSSPQFSVSVVGHATEPIYPLYIVAAYPKPAAPLAIRVLYLAASDIRHLRA
jgi:hypothetical protein